MPEKLSSFKNQACTRENEQFRKTESGFRVYSSNGNGGRNREGLLGSRWAHERCAYHAGLIITYQCVPPCAVSGKETRERTGNTRRFLKIREPKTEDADEQRTRKREKGRETSLGERGLHVSLFPFLYFLENSLSPRPQATLPSLSSPSSLFLLPLSRAALI